MSIACAQIETVVTVPDYRNLQAFWQHHGGQMINLLVKRIVVEKPLTKPQFNRLHKRLKELL
jgi:hypothetical protein